MIAKLVRRPKQQQLEYLIEKLLNTLDELTASKGRLRKRPVRATAGFFRAQFETLKASGRERG